MIPDEAVEAAVKAFRETKFMGDALMNAIEAAAPHMMVSAWEEGREYGIDECAGDVVGRSNPYRKTTNAG